MWFSHLPWILSGIFHNGGYPFSQTYFWKKRKQFQKISKNAQQGIWTEFVLSNNTRLFWMWLYGTLCFLVYIINRYSSGFRRKWINKRNSRGSIFGRLSSKYGRATSNILSWEPWVPVRWALLNTEVLTILFYHIQSIIFGWGLLNIEALAAEQWVADCRIARCWLLNIKALTLEQLWADCWTVRHWLQMSKVLTAEQWGAACWTVNHWLQNR